MLKVIKGVGKIRDQTRSTKRSNVPDKLPLLHILRIYISFDSDYQLIGGGMLGIILSVS